MKKGNVIELHSYRQGLTEKTLDPAPEAARDDKPVSKELQLAINQLIQRLRKHGPMRKQKRL